MKRCTAIILLLPLFGASFSPETSALAVTPHLYIANLGRATAPLDGFWQFHTGDDPRWADPSWDDSHWEQLQADKSWTAQGHYAHTGFGWYRKHFEINQLPNSNQLAILIPKVESVYEIYLNGTKIGSDEKLPPGAQWSIPRPRSFPLPISADGVTRGVLSIRVWKGTLTPSDTGTSGGLEGIPIIGEKLTLDALVRASGADRMKALLPDLLIGMLTIVMGMLALLLYVRAYREPVCLWLALFLVATGWWMWGNFIPPNVWVNLIATIQQSLQDIALWFLLIYLFGLQREPQWRKRLWIAVSLYLGASIAECVLLRFFWEHGGAGAQWLDTVLTSIVDVAQLIPIFIFVVAIKRGTWRSGLVVAMLAALYDLYQFACGVGQQGQRFIHLQFSELLFNLGIDIGAYHFSIFFILQTALFAAMIVTVGHDLVVQLRRHEQVEMEMKSATEVQRSVIPEAGPTVPGVKVSSVYKPAHEVGGDFFQIIPQNDGSTLIAIGDVSGKGLRAAMSVAMIVGTLRGLTQTSSSPSVILDGLNKALLGHIQDGFATCLLLKLRPGLCTTANAGHLSPFLNGAELDLAASLPLGLAVDADYAEQEFALQPGDYLTLLTDGVPEARGTGGELFGFERTQAISDRPAEEIAKIAQSFGQEDDITVLTMKFSEDQAIL